MTWFENLTAGSKKVILLQLVAFVSSFSFRDFWTCSHNVIHIQLSDQTDQSSPFSPLSEVSVHLLCVFQLEDGPLGEPGDSFQQPVDMATDKDTTETSLT